MGFCRRSGPASDATYIDRQLQAVANILRTQGDVYDTHRVDIYDNYYCFCILVSEFEEFLFIRKGFVFPLRHRMNTSWETAVVFVRFLFYIYL